jgi:hypothetical protein
MKEYFAKLFARVIAGINGKQFDQVVDWVIEAGQDPDFRTGIDQALRVFSMYNANFAKQSSWVVRTVVQVAYLVAKLRGEET